MCALCSERETEFPLNPDPVSGVPDDANRGGIAHRQPELSTFLRDRVRTAKQDGRRTQPCHETNAHHRPHR
jgi:hypothetical protein